MTRDDPFTFYNTRRWGTILQFLASCGAGGNLFHVLLLVLTTWISIPSIHDYWFHSIGLPVQTTFLSPRTRYHRFVTALARRCDTIYLFTTKLNQHCIFPRYHRLFFFLPHVGVVFPQNTPTKRIIQTIERIIIHFPISGKVLEFYQRFVTAKYLRIYAPSTAFCFIMEVMRRYMDESRWWHWYIHHVGMTFGDCVFCKANLAYGCWFGVFFIFDFFKCLVLALFHYVGYTRVFGVANAQSPRCVCRMADDCDVRCS